MGGGAKATGKIENVGRMEDPQHSDGEVEEPEENPQKEKTTLAICLGTLELVLDRLAKEMEHNGPELPKTPKRRRRTATEIAEEKVTIARKLLRKIQAEKAEQAAKKVMEKQSQTSKKTSKVAVRNTDTDLDYDEDGLEEVIEKEMTISKVFSPLDGSPAQAPVALPELDMVTTIRPRVAFRLSQGATEGAISSLAPSGNGSQTYVSDSRGGISLATEVAASSSVTTPPLNTISSLFTTDQSRILGNMEVDLCRIAMAWEQQNEIQREELASIREK